MEIADGETFLKGGRQKHPGKGQELSEIRVLGAELSEFRALGAISNWVLGVIVSG